MTADIADYTDTSESSALSALDCGDLHAGFTRLHCPDCGHEFLLAFSCKQRGLCASCHQHRTLTEGAFIAVVETRAEILAVLAPLGLALPHERPFALGPPRLEVAVLIDAATGECHALDPPDFPPGLPYPQLRDEPIRLRAEVMEPGESFDPAGFELPPPPQVAPADSGQGELFGDVYFQPDANDGEPVFRGPPCLRPPPARPCFPRGRRPEFWPEAADESTPDAAYVQADALDCSG